MFGNLFEEEEEEGLSESPGTQKHVPKPCCPPRGSTGLCGIRNQGATCYLNSLLQTLLFTPEFRESLFQLGPEELGRLSDKDKPGAKVRVIPIQLQTLFARLLLADQEACSTTELTDSFGWTNSEELQQHDVQELSRILFSAVESSLVGTSGQQLIADLYHGTIVNQIICGVCGRISRREEDFQDLTVAVAGYPSLRHVLTDQYVEMERMEGRNQYRCEQCNKLVNARKGARLKKLPPILTFSLLRFSYDYVKWERYKETGKFTFPKELDMADFCQDAEQEADTLYELFSVVIHKGSAHGGHYHAYIRDIDGLGLWISPEEQEVAIPTDPNTGKVDYIEVSNPAQLLRAILLQEGRGGTTVDRLGQALVQQTGVPWNKRFKKQYGPITRFLKKYDDIFEVNPVANWVSLKEPISTATVPDTTTNSLPSGDSCKEEETVSTEGSSCHAGEGCAVENKPSATKNSTENAVNRSGASDVLHHWFDFNDSRVWPISESEIDTQYQGKESAYMLFYRQKSLSRPQEAKGFPAYGMQAWQLAQVIEENSKLQKEREEYDTAVNTISVDVLVSHEYMYQGGAMQPLPGCHSNVMRLTLDRRKSIRDLKVSIEEMLGSLWSGPMCLHTAKHLPAGLHLYDCISGDDSRSVQEVGVTDDTQLFVWDGKQVGGLFVPTGEQWEPIVINIIHSTGAGRHSNTTRGVPKCWTLGEMRVLISELTSIPLQALVLSRLADKSGETGENPSSVFLHNSQDGSSLQVLGLQNGDRLLAETRTNRRKRGGGAEVQNPGQSGASQLTLSVEDHCSGNNMSARITIDRQETIGTVKTLALSHFGFDDLHGGCHLCIYNTQRLGPPLYEDETVESVSVKTEARLVLQPGKAPASHQMVLYVSMVPSVDDVADFQVLTDKKATVGDCLRETCGRAGISPEKWHLCRTSWCGEPEDPLNDLDISLEAAALHHGDLVLLQEGRVLPKGFVCVPIYLYPSLEQSTMGGGDSGMLGWITARVNSLLLSSKPDEHVGGTNGVLFLGDLEISREATLQELKASVQGLPHMTDIQVPTPGFLRVRTVEAGRPARVLRGANQTLKYLKVSSATRLCVQVLPQEEDLSPTVLVLKLRQRIPETRMYTPEEELLWDTCKGAVPPVLKQVIADRLLLPVERVAIAKHFPEKFQWLAIQVPKSSGKPKGKKKGGGGGKSGEGANLKKTPYLLQDGDTIGVKDLQFDPYNKDDFSTLEDDVGKEELRRAEEEKKQKRQQGKNLTKQGRKDRKPETGITIHVDDFR